MFDKLKSFFKKRKSSNYSSDTTVIDRTYEEEFFNEYLPGGEESYKFLLSYFPTHSEEKICKKNVTPME